MLVTDTTFKIIGSAILDAETGLLCCRMRSAMMEILTTAMAVPPFVRSKQILIAPVHLLDCRCVPSRD